MGLSPDCRVVVRGRISSGRRQVLEAAHVGGRLLFMATLSFQSSHQVVMLRLVAFRANARRGFEDEYSLGAARCWPAVVPVRHRRGLLPCVHGAFALLGRVDARRMS